ncbi:MAG TPA: hypothetical protein VLH09_08360 [Bryobacteraceae bacterium]|nr:hypothetical protein [Bryobacteraceae bacterium]
MNRFEEVLHQALRRKEAPAGFTERVLAKLPPPAARPAPWVWMRWALAAALPVVLLLTVQLDTERRRRAEGELAKAQMVTALRIAAEKFEHTREKVIRVTSRGPAAVRPANSI